MGGKESKLTCIAYEDAVKRVSETDLKRLREAAKRLGNSSGGISRQTFFHDVLGDNVPFAQAEIIYTACSGGQKGISFKDLLCGLVVITRGTLEEKTKLLFNVYAGDGGQYITRTSMLKVVQQCEGKTNVDGFRELFGTEERVAYAEYRDWVQRYAGATELSQWLLAQDQALKLSDDLETPTFYQSLAGVTHLEEREILELEQKYWSLKGLSRSGRFDRELLTPLVTPPLPAAVVDAFFCAFDENRDGHIDFKEMACGISAACRGPLLERHKFCFKVFDADRDGRLDGAELRMMVEVLHCMSVPVSEQERDGVVAALLEGSENGSYITQEEYLMWTLDNPLSDGFPSLLFQMCHVVLGLRPRSRQEEADIVLGWLSRQESLGYRVGALWYLVNMAWWSGWSDYVGYQAEVVAQGPASAQAALPGHPTLTRSSSRDKRCKTDNVVANDTSPVVVTSVKALSENPSIDCLRPRAAGLRPAATSSSLGSLDRASTPSPSPSPNPSRKLGGAARPGAAAPVPGAPPRPGAVDNVPLTQPPAHKVTNLTGEGGRLRTDITLQRGRDFELVPESLWKALVQWYGGSPGLPRQVIQPAAGAPLELELHPISLRLLRHQAPPARGAPASWSGSSGGGYTGGTLVDMSSYSNMLGAGAAPKRYVAYTAAFSRQASVRQVYEFLCGRLRLRPEDTRLWHFRDQNNMLLWEDDSPTLEQLKVADYDQVLIEVRNKDQTWPEEMSSIANLSRPQAARTRLAPIEKGVSGLNNVGNTCFMNTALQCCSNTAALTKYFMENMHLYELNRKNPLGMKGHIALCYAELIQEIWSGTTKTIAPLKLRFTIGKYAPRFSGVQQHDAQELLAFLLDGLHEDLNRVHDKPYVELRDSEGRPDVIVAQEAWENHILRNKSIIVDLFHGQLKSKVTCRQCGHESVRFDPFNVLSLPLPMENFTHLEITLVRLDGSVPVRYGMRLNMDARYSAVKQQLQTMSGVHENSLLICELADPLVKYVVPDDQRVRQTLVGLYAFEVPPPAARPGSARTGSGVSESSEHSQPASLSPPGQQSRLVPNGGPHLPVGELSLEEDGPAPVVRGYADSDAASTASSVASCHMDLDDTGKGFVVAYHRKMERQESYLLSAQKTRPALFGLPVIVTCGSEVTGADLYRAVWTQVARLVSPLPPVSEAGLANHAQDCDDSLGYKYPFVLKCVNRSGCACSACPWFGFCRGCSITCADVPMPAAPAYLAIDWDPTALHLRYLGGQEKVSLEDPSVPLTRQRQTEPIDLPSCLQAFTREETLGEQEKYYCSKCRTHQPALKKLQIWRLPPVLIVHLKRFQCVGGRWVKSQKVVRFPFQAFDPTDYLASVPRQTVLHHRAELGELAADSPELDWDVLSCGDGPDAPLTPAAAAAAAAAAAGPRGRIRNGSVMYGDVLQDFHQHQLRAGSDPLLPRYRLYALSCHTGILGGGHYVCYAQNAAGRWFFYNDSSCKEVSESQIDTNSAYILFYEREGINYDSYMPKVTGKPVNKEEVQQEYESEFKKVCSVM